jgi:aspartate oxidase
MTDFRRTLNTFGDGFPVEEDALHGGFNFDNCRRNELIMAREAGEQAPKIKAMKTGTTIVGVLYKVRG